MASNVEPMFFMMMETRSSSSTDFPAKARLLAMWVTLSTKSLTETFTFDVEQLITQVHDAILRLRSIPFFKKHQVSCEDLERATVESTKDMSELLSNSTQADPFSANLHTPH